MELLYHSDNFVVVQVDVPTEGGGLSRGGYEIVDKHARQEIFIEGLMAESFKQGVQALAESQPDSPEAFDEFIERYTQLARQTLAVH